MNKYAKFSLTFFVAAFSFLWVGFYLVKITGIENETVLFFPAFVTIILNFFGLFLAGIVNFFKWYSE